MSEWLTALSFVKLRCFRRVCVSSEWRGTAAFCSRPIDISGLLIPRGKSCRPENVVSVLESNYWNFRSKQYQSPEYADLSALRTPLIDWART